MKSLELSLKQSVKDETLGFRAEGRVHWLVWVGYVFLFMTLIKSPKNVLIWRLMIDGGKEQARKHQKTYSQILDHKATRSWLVCEEFVVGSGFGV